LRTPPNGNTNEGWVERSETHESPQINPSQPDPAGTDDRGPPGGTFFFSVNLADRHRRLLTDQLDTLRTAFREVHPGKVLLDELLVPMGISQNRLARDIGVPPRRINEIVHGNRAVTADTALRLARYFGTSEGFWMGLQADYDLEEARTRLGVRLERDVRPRAA